MKYLKLKAILKVNPLMKNNVYSVYQVNNYIKLLLQDDIFLNKISIKGEISNFKQYSSGTIFFSLKDGSSALNCVMYAQNITNLTFDIENGFEVICTGSISLYEKSGQYQFLVNHIEVCGKGNLYLEFENLKKKLLKLGLFESKFKKKIPLNPSSIAVITSLDGAVLHDILKVSSRRNPNVKIIIVPITVQGNQSKDDIINAIESVNKWGQADTIILARGGGSLEDLCSFNEEDVAKAIFNSKIPIISAIGHEVDFTIADFVADLRAATPSVAAEIAVPEVQSLKNTILQNYLKIKKNITMKLLQNKLSIVLNINSEPFISFKNKLNLYKGELKNISVSLNNIINSRITQDKITLQSKTENLENNSPINILRKGYSLIYDEENNILSTKKSVKKDDILNINFYDGSIKAQVLEER